MENKDNRMERVLQICDDTVSSVPFVPVITFIFFYLSIKRCFAREGKKRVLLILLTVLMNPAVCFWVSLFLTGVVGWVYTWFAGIDYSAEFNIHEAVPALITAGAGALIYLSIILLFARLMAKRFDTRLKSAVTFVFLMYNTIYLNQVRDFETVNVFGIPGGEYIISIAASLLSLIIIGVFYRCCVIPMSELKLDGAKIEWKVFLIPPSAFILVYFFFTITELLIFDSGVVVTISAFSMVIVCLFVWAFYVIIKNIKATNEAIEAKDLAAEMARTEALREADLNIAKNIQSSALPSVFPPFPEHQEFELFASMNAAKEVGGDFYDFYTMLCKRYLGCA